MVTADERRTSTVCEADPVAEASTGAIVCSWEDGLEELR